MIYFLGAIHDLLEDEGLDDLLDPLIEYLLPKLNEQSLELAANIYATTVADRTTDRRQTHNELQNKLNTMIGDVRLFEKGIKVLPSQHHNSLVKYMLKTLCTDIVTEILNYTAAEQNLNIVTDAFNNDQRIKFVNDLWDEYKPALLSLVKSLSGESIDVFMTAVEESLTVCGMIIKKIDRKKDRTVVLNHKHELLEQLNKTDDLALVLHLAVLVIFTIVTQCRLHASGKHVAAILAFLKHEYLSAEQAHEFETYYGKIDFLLFSCRTW